MSTNRNIADYYNQTLNHYQNWWKLDNNLAVHYGIWDENTSNFQEALANTNRLLMETADIKESEHILDAGCGVGGSAFYLAKQKKVIIEGITLSEKQHNYATKKCKELHLENQVNFSIQDYTNTNFKDSSFDLIWAIESITSAPNKIKFINEAHRLLKTGGRIIIADYFKSKEHQNDPKKLLEKWRILWSMASFDTLKNYTKLFEENGFKRTVHKDVTKHITSTAKRMFWSYLLGGPLAVIYNMFNKPSPFARNHYKSGLYQYKALKQGLWNYNVLLFEKIDSYKKRN